MTRAANEADRKVGRVILNSGNFLKAGRESRKGQSLRSSHLLTFFPTFPFCSTDIWKYRHFVIHSDVEYGYDKKIPILALKTQ